jgi:hypothetical protein
MSYESESPDEKIARLTERVLTLESLLTRISDEVKKIIKVMDHGKV